MATGTRRGQVVFLWVWLTLWTSAILVVLWLLGGALLSGELGAAPFLLIWLGFAGLGLYAGVRRLMTLTGLARPPAPPPGPGRGVWRDDMPAAKPGEPSER